MADLAELQQRIAHERAERGFTRDPVRVLALLMEEVGEVARELKKTWSANYEPFEAERLAEELADAFVLVSALASEYHVDLATAVEHKFFELDSQREWKSSTSR